MKEGYMRGATKIKTKKPSAPPPAPMESNIKPNNSYNIKTTVCENGEIEQVLSLRKRDISRWIIDTRDEQIREGLIKLGWTPPESEQD